MLSFMRLAIGINKLGDEGRLIAALAPPFSNIRPY